MSKNGVTEFNQGIVIEFWARKYGRTPTERIEDRMRELAKEQNRITQEIIELDKERDELKSKKLYEKVEVIEN
jgi:hypothetical protein